MRLSLRQALAGSLLSLPSILVPGIALAHCPLCTAGAGLLALGAYSIGVNGMTIGIFLGSFALAMGLWVAKILKKQYVPRQAELLGLFSWVLTIIPLRPMFQDYGSYYLDWGGGYGTLFNRTYIINLFLVGSVIGAALLLIAPRLSRQLTAKRGKSVPFQGMILNFGLLIVAGLITQFLI